LTRFDTWRAGYIVVGVFQLALAVCFTLTLPMWNQGESKRAGDQPRRLTDYQTPLGETLRRGRVWLSAALFFFYTGAEASLGVWTYTLLTEARGVQAGTAGLVAGSYWAMFTAGRILAGLFSKRIGVNALVQVGLSGAWVGAVLLWWNPGGLFDLVSVGIIGFAIAPIFPALVSGTSGRVGARFAANTIGFQMAAAGLGAAAIPSLVGVLARQNSLEVIPVCVVVLFSVLLGLFWTATRLGLRAARATG